jgi:hypothetical protein
MRWYLTNLTKTVAMNHGAPRNMFRAYRLSEVDCSIRISNPQSVELPYRSRKLPPYPAPFLMPGPPRRSSIFAYHDNVNMKHAKSGRLSRSPNVREPAR